MTTLNQDLTGAASRGVLIAGQKTVDSGRKKNFEHSFGNFDYAQYKQAQDKLNVQH